MCCPFKKAQPAAGPAGGGAARKRGAVLVLVLGMVLVMSWLAVEILSAVRKELAVEASPADEARLRQTSYQLLELSLAVLAEIRRFEGDLYSPSQGWGIPLAYAGLADTEKLATALTEPGGRNRPDPADGDAGEPAEREPGPPEPAGDDEGAEADDLLEGLLAEIEEESEPRAEGFVRPVTRVETGGGEGVNLGPETAAISLPPGLEARVRLYDESGKLPLTGTTEERWNLFFEEMGFEESEGKKLTESLLDWMDADDEERENGAETSTYAQEDPPYRAPNRPLRDFEELRLVEGFRELFFDESGIPNDNFLTFRRNVSLHHTGPVNLNTASELILETLAEEQGFEADNVLDFLAGSDLEFGTEDDRILRPGLSEENLPKDGEGDPIAAGPPIRYLTAEIAVSSGQAVYYLNAVIDLSRPHPGGVYPFRITRIVENQPLS